MYRILVVEDEKELNLMICDYLASAGFVTESAFDGITAADKIEKQSFDLILLDIMLPGQDGFSILSQLQSRELPGVILITARTLESDKLRAFAKGADDYLTKPFSFQEMEARIRALLRRLPLDESSPKVIKSHPLELNLSSFRCYLLGKEINLTRAQFNILAEMAHWPGRVFSRDILLEFSGELDSDAMDRTVDVHIKNIRKRLGEYKDLIETVRGVGYRLVSDAKRGNG